MEQSLVTFDSSAYRRAINSHAGVEQTSQNCMLLVLLKNKKTVGCDGRVTLPWGKQMLPSDIADPASRGGVLVTSG